MVVRRDPQTVCHIQRFFFGPHRHTGVTLLLGVVPVVVVSRKFQLDLTFLKLRLLHAEDIRVQVVKHIQEVLPGAGPQTVHIPRDKLSYHFCSFLSDAKNGQVNIASMHCDLTEIIAAD